jgi:hypothetical protein
MNLVAGTVTHEDMITNKKVKFNFWTIYFFYEPYRFFYLILSFDTTKQIQKHVCIFLAWSQFQLQKVSKQLDTIVFKQKA